MGELDAEVKRVTEEREMWRSQQILQEERWVKLVASLPPCPTCDGQGSIAYTPMAGAMHDDEQPCPENGGNCDGKASIEWMAAVFNDVFDENLRDRVSIVGSSAVIDHLRGIR